MVKWGEGQETPSEHVYQEEEDQGIPITFKYTYNQNQPLISNYTTIIELHDINGNIGTIVRYINVGEVKIRFDVDFISLRQRFGYFAMFPSSLNYTECPTDWISYSRNVEYKRAGVNFSVTVNDGYDTYGWNAALLPSSVPIGSKWVLRNKSNDLISWPRMVEFVPEDDLYLSGSYCKPPGDL